MTDASPTPEGDTTDSTNRAEDQQPQQPQQPLTEDDYAQGTTSEPDGASRDVPAGEDYAGSGF